MSESKPKETPATPAPAANTWTTWVALTTTILAVAAAFSTLKGGSYSTQTQLATVNASNKWSYFQSKSIKENEYKIALIQLDIAAANATTPEGKAVAAKAAEKATKEVSRYEKEKDEIKAEAESLESLAKYCQKRGGNFGLAVMFLQIAIMLSAVAALLKKKPAWLLGLAIGVIGIGYLLYAWPLYETLVGAPPAPAATAK